VRFAERTRFTGRGGIADSGELEGLGEMPLRIARGLGIGDDPRHASQDGRDGGDGDDSRNGGRGNGRRSSGRCHDAAPGGRDAWRRRRRKRRVFK